MRILAILLYYVLQLFPLTYRTRYWDADRQLHFCVWRQWLGRCYSVDDVVVVYDAEMARQCIAAIERGEYQTLDEVIAELRAKGRQAGTALVDSRNPRNGTRRRRTMPTFCISDLHASRPRPPRQFRLQRPGRTVRQLPGLRGADHVAGC